MDWKLLEGYMIIGDEEGDQVGFNPLNVKEVAEHPQRQRTE